MNKQVSDIIASYGDWRSAKLNELRDLINSVDPVLKEEVKWGTPVWIGNGLVCAISGFKDHVKLNFFKGSQLSDANKLFNSGLESKEHRSINFAQKDKLDSTAIKSLVKEAVELDQI